MSWIPWTLWKEENWSMWGLVRTMVCKAHSPLLSSSLLHTTHTHTHTQVHIRHTYTHMTLHTRTHPIDGTHMHTRVHTHAHTCTHSHFLPISSRSQGTGSSVFPPLLLLTPGHRMLFSPNARGWGTLTGHHSEGRKVLRSEQRRRELPDEPFEQVGRVIVVNLIPAKKAGVEISLQLLFQPLKEEGA